MYLLGLLLWIAVSGGLAWLVARLLSRRSSKLWLRPLLALILLPVVFLAPLSDEIVGKFQFDRLCKEAKEVKIYATHPVGEELYTSEGKWKLREILNEKDRAPVRTAYESLVRWDLGDPFPEEMPAVIPIRKYHRKIFDNGNGRLLAEWVQYGATGGWVSRQMGGAGGGGLIVQQQCMPDIVQRSEIEQQILPFRNSRGEKK